MTETFTFNAIPQTLAELQALPEADLQSPFQTVALAVCVFSVYPQNRAAALEMLDWLMGPETVSPYAESFIKDRFSDKDYVPRSFFAGATPANNYEPAQPFTVTVSDNPYSYTDETHATLYIQSGGADSPRPVGTRKKPSTGEWFLTEYSGILAGIRTPAAADPWA